MPLPKVVTDFLNEQRTFNEQDDAAVSALVKSFDGIKLDVDAMKKTIEDLKNTPGTPTPEETALMQQLQSQRNALSSKITAASAALKDLDESEQPEVPE